MALSNIYKEVFLATAINDFQPFFLKCSITDVWQGPKYPFACFSFRANLKYSFSSLEQLSHVLFLNGSTFSGTRFKLLCKIAVSKIFIKINISRCFRRLLEKGRERQQQEKKKKYKKENGLLLEDYRFLQSFMSKVLK